jgi:hypothetical protein
MPDANYTTTISVDQNPAIVFEAITNVRGWWSDDIEGQADKIGDTFKHRYMDVHRCELTVKDLVPGEKVVWTVLANYFSFTEDQTEWVGNDIIFDISAVGDKTEIRFTQRGLVPDYECYDLCTAGWHSLINGSLRDLIARGQSMVDLRETTVQLEASSGGK